MPDEPDSPIAHRAFDRLAAGYDRDGHRKPSNAYLERPATRSLLPAVAGCRILDAGCGAGHLAAALGDRGGAVVGLDVSATMAGYARDRAPNAEIVQAALERDLPFADDVFEGVVGSLSFHYVEAWEPLFRELRRVLVPGGWVVYSVQHPHADFEEYEDVDNYHEVERVSATWDSFGVTVDVPTYRRPLAELVTPAIEAGFRLERLLEPTPTAAFRKVNPARYEYEATHPNFLCCRFSLLE